MFGVNRQPRKSALSCTNWALARQQIVGIRCSSRRYFASVCVPAARAALPAAKTCHWSAGARGQPHRLLRPGVHRRTDATIAGALHEHLVARPCDALGFCQESCRRSAVQRRERPLKRPAGSQGRWQSSRAGEDGGCRRTWRKSRSSSCPRQNRPAEATLPKPCVHRIRPSIPRWSCSSLFLKYRPSDAAEVCRAPFG
jgi:hypothetical protein